MSLSQPAPQPEQNPPQQQTALVPVQTQVSADYYLKTGKTFYQSFLARARKTDLEQAIRHFQKAVEMEPNMAEAYLQLASALWDQGTINLDLAQFYCETALKLDPKQSDANLYLGYFLQRAGFPEDALQQYQTAIAKNWWRSSRARIAMGNVLLKQAVQTTQKPKQLTLAASGLTQFLLGCSLLVFDKPTLAVLHEAMTSDAQVYAIEWLAKGFKQLKWPKAVETMYRFGVKTMPGETLFPHLLGDMYFYDKRDAQSAIPYYERALVLEPGSLTLLKKLGKAYAKVEDVTKATRTLETVLTHDQNDFDSYYQLGQLYCEGGAYTKALYYYKEAEQHRPHSPYVHSNMAYTLFKLDDTEGAYEEYKIALEFGTDPIWLSTVAQTLATISYQVHHDAKCALEFIQQSLHYNPDNTEALAMLADLYFENGQMEQALKAYRLMLELEPHNADCYGNIGYILWQLDHNQEAIDAYLAAIQLDRNNSVAHNNLGVIYLDEFADAAKALPLFETAFRLKPTYTLACFNAGRSLEALGRDVEAANRYSEALSLNQLSPELDSAEIQAHLDRLFN